MVEDGPGGPTEAFRPTSGRVTGVLALLAVAGTVVLGVTEPFPAPVVTGALVVGVLAWASLLRPRVLVVGRSLVLRNMLETVTIPLAAIEGLVVRQVLAVRVGGKRFVSPALGRSLRTTMQSRRRPVMVEEPVLTRQPPPYADIVEDRIRQLIEDDRAQRRIAPGSAEAAALAAEVRREPAWIEIGLLVVTTIAFLVTLVL